ncbi:General stress protein CTC [Corynebacterium kalinowskii]|uniref:Large ribosomal subunit protein bL25 n=1 Tax=Corynebacterium kalinowskii TaxID=2675216 RepID=A0A6B8VS83_9CORY|nr:50S ribosomal protein L25/general stress protein Ctc [Corynebacterium kalinowskii]QGU02487.1 General stress protein CTC [Corynebacterium kalinowskii]
MSNEAIALVAAPRKEFGKGFARRARVAGLVPAVIYAKGFEPLHITVDRIEFTKIVRNHGVNTVVTVDIEGEKQLAMIKHVDQNVLNWQIDHADLLAIKKGEKVEVEVPVVTAGEPGPGTMLIQETDTIRVLADVMSIPEEIVVSVAGKVVGDQILAGDIELPEGTELTDEADVLMINFVAPEDNEAEADEAAEAAGVVEDAPEEAPAEESAE